MLPLLLTNRCVLDKHRRIRDNLCDVRKPCSKCFMFLPQPTQSPFKVHVWYYLLCDVLRSAPQAKSQQDKRMWILHLKRLILENHPAKIPAKVRASPDSSLSVHRWRKHRLWVGCIGNVTPSRPPSFSFISIFLSLGFFSSLSFHVLWFLPLFSFSHNHFSVPSSAFGHVWVSLQGWRSPRKFTVIT